MRVAIYVRVSTEEQSLEGYSVSAQKERCTRFIESQLDWDLVKVYADPGYSAKDLQRPSMEQLIEDVEKDMFDVIVVYRLDRMVRSVLDLHQLLKLFEKNHVKFKSVTEVFDTTTAMGRFFITMVGAMAEWERNNLSERVSMGMEQMTREGKWKGGHVGFGHDRVNGEFVVVEHEAQVLKDMYRWYSEGLSDRKIAIKLNGMGITTRIGAEWTERKVRSALINKKNIGILQYGVRVNQDKYFEVEDVYPPIIDKETFYKCYSVRKARRNQHGRQATSRFYYSGILTCARCGKTFKGLTTREYKRYRCRGTLMKQCDMPTTSESLIDIKFIEMLKQITFDPSDLVLDKAENVNQEKIDGIKKEIEKIKLRRKKWQYAWANEDIKDEEFQQLMKEEQEREKYYKDKLNNLAETEQHTIDAEMLETMRTAADNWQMLLESEKKQLMQIAIEKIVVEIDKDAPKEDRITIKEIVWN